MIALWQNRGLPEIWDWRGYKWWGLCRGYKWLRKNFLLRISRTIKEWAESSKRGQFKQRAKWVLYIMDRCLLVNSSPRIAPSFFRFIQVFQNGKTALFFCRRILPYLPHVKVWFVNEHDPERPTNFDLCLQKWRATLLHLIAAGGRKDPTERSRTDPQALRISPDSKIGEIETLKGWVYKDTRIEWISCSIRGRWIANGMKN